MSVGCQSGDIGGISCTLICTAFISMLLFYNLGKHNGTMGVAFLVPNCQSQRLGQPNLFWPRSHDGEFEYQRPWQLYLTLYRVRQDMRTGRILM